MNWSRREAFSPSPMGCLQDAYATYIKLAKLWGNYSHTDGQRLTNGQWFKERRRFTQRDIQPYGKCGLNDLDAQYWYVRGATYNDLGLDDAALADLDKAVSLDPRHPLAHNTLGLVRARLGQLEQAVEDFSLAIAINPGFALAYNNRGAVYRQLGELEKALNDLDQAIRLDPQHARAYYNRALTLCSTQQRRGCTARC